MAARHHADRAVRFARDDDTSSSVRSLAMDTKSWNAIGRAKNERVCDAFEEIIDRGGSSNEDLTGDERDEDLADAVLAEVVALNEAGRWREARESFDPAHRPFIHHMEETDAHLTAAIILGADAFLVRRGDWDEEGPVLYIDGDTITELPGIEGFAISRNRQWVALAGPEGVIVSEGFRTTPSRTIAWPVEDPIRPNSFGISDDGRKVVIANDEVGVWLLDGEAWTKLMPRKDIGDDDDAAPDVVHAAISPDGNFVAYGWQDAPGHYVDDVSKAKPKLHGVVGTVSDTPYNVHFTDDSKSLLSNTRHMQSGVTVCATLESLRGTEEYDDVPEGSAHTDEYLRAYGMVLLPGDIAWIGGAGWSHAAPLGGGKPAFTHLFGSTLNAFDYDPKSKRAIVASASCMLHVVDPHSAADRGRERGYKPRRELYRWIFWDSLKKPIRW